MGRLGGDRADDDQAAGFAVRAGMDIEGYNAQPERLDGFGLSWRGWRLMIERGACGGGLLALGAVGEDAVVADAHEVGWER